MYFISSPLLRTHRFPRLWGFGGETPFSAPNRVELLNVEILNTTPSRVLLQIFVFTQRRVRSREETEKVEQACLK